MQKEKETISVKIFYQIVSENEEVVTQMAKVELTCMCMVLDRANQRVLVQERTKSWKGISFPGGHIEDGEGLAEAVIREVKEETGLTVSDLTACGVTHWFNEQTGERYFVFHFKTETFHGELLAETEEGKVYWVDVETLPHLPLSRGFHERLPMFFGERYMEGFAVWREDIPDRPLKWF